MLQDKIITFDISSSSMLQYSYENGCFFSYDVDKNSVVNALKCRDEFAMYNKFYYCPGQKETRIIKVHETQDYPYKWIGFSKENINYDQIVKFLTNIENKLGIKNKSKYYKCIGTIKDYYNPSKFQEVKDKFILIELSSFWTETQNFIKLSLYTLLLRCSVCYYSEDLQESLKEYTLASSVIPAINHFLDGNTHQTFKKWNTKHGEGGSYYYGFVGEFEGKTPEGLSKLLVKPKELL